MSERGYKFSSGEKKQVAEKTDVSQKSTQPSLCLPSWAQSCVFAGKTGPETAMPRVLNTALFVLGSDPPTPVSHLWNVFPDPLNARRIRKRIGRYSYSLQICIDVKQLLSINSFIWLANTYWHIIAKHPALCKWQANISSWVLIMVWRSVMVKTTGALDSQHKSYLGILNSR